MAPSRPNPHGASKTSSGTAPKPARAGGPSGVERRVSEPAGSQQNRRYELRRTVKTSLKARDASPSLPHRVLRGTNHRAPRTSTQVLEYARPGPSPLSGSTLSPNPSLGSNSPIQSDTVVDDHSEANHDGPVKKEFDDEWLRRFHAGRGSLTHKGDVKMVDVNNQRVDLPLTSSPPSQPLATRHSIKESDFGEPGDQVGNSDREEDEPVETSSSKESDAMDNYVPPSRLQASLRSGGKPAAQQFKYFSVVRKLRELHFLRILGSREYIYRSSVDAARPLVLYWLGRKLIGIYDRDRAGWLYEDNDFLKRAENNPDITEDVERAFQAQGADEDVKSPLWPGLEC